ncbi:aminotransferase class III-fold pyridoxal phosphate-dependent enzyme [Photobacterium sp. ZSDE20]|nr:aminotransferase class III-fold pyridoxal phosphate-dependent enzyme [Photobacterium sp. ZSDE20]
MKGIVDDYSSHVNKGWVNTLESIGSTPPVFEQAEGDLLVDLNGEEWFDFIGHYGAVIFGHNYPPIIDFTKQLLEKKPISMTPFGISSLPAELAKVIINRLGLTGSWNNWSLSTGAEAIESAVKLATFTNGRKKVLARTKGFHGLSKLTLQLNDSTFWYEAYDSIVEPGFVDFFSSTSEAIQLLGTKEYSAVIIEPIQAMAGGVVLDKDEAREIRNACNNTNTLMITDEVFTGMGRSGKYSAMQALEWEIEPDIIVLSKTLTGGIIPSSQLVVKQELFENFSCQPGYAKLLGSTFSGNNISQSIALKVIELIDDLYDSSDYGLEQSKFHLMLTELNSNFPNKIINVVSYSNLNFLKFDSPETAFFIWSELFSNKILTTVCSHQPDTIKLMPSFNQSERSKRLLYETISVSLEAWD